MERESQMKIGVAITTHAREDVTKETVKRWRSMLPPGAVLIVVDDASPTPYPDADYRFEENVGIARAKNKCLELLEDMGVTDYFLSDNDCYPIHKDWYRPYINSPEPHLSYQFHDLSGPVKLRDIELIHEDAQHVAYSGQRGCLLYYSGEVLYAVGGFDSIYGRALYEHSDLANRIHSAGLTTWRYADVANSNRYWHSLDEHGKVDRTIPQNELKSFIKRNATIHNMRRDSGYQGYVPYRSKPKGSRNVVITTLLTSNIDPQRGHKWPADASILSEWLESVERFDVEGIVLADELSKLPRGYSNTKVVNVVPSKINVYYQRWTHIYQYLRDNEDIQWVWCTDGSDVEILRDPFHNIAEGVLYTGYEPESIGTQWMRQNHPSKSLQHFIKTNSRETLLNAGVVGGDRETVMKLAREIISEYYDTEARRFWGVDPSRSKSEVGDMAAFNMAAYNGHGGNLITGPMIVTDFKAYKDNGLALFRHK